MLAALHAAAQEAPKPAEPAKAPATARERIEVTGPDAVDERRESTAAKIVVNREEILRHGDSTILEALRRLPGVSVGGSGGRGGDIRLRGLGGGYTQILVNGERMPPGFSLEQLSPELVERIEIYRSATAEFSTRAVAGTINIVLRRAVSSRQRELKLALNEYRGRPSATLSGQYADSAGALSYALPFSLGSFRFLGDSRAEQLGFDLGEAPDLLYVTESISSSEGLHGSLSPKLQWAIAEDHSLALDLFANLNRFESRRAERTTTLVGAGPIFDAADARDESRSASARATATWIRGLPATGRMEARAGLSYNWRDGKSASLFRSEVGAPALTRETTTGATDAGFTTTGKYSAPLIPEHALVVGWDAAHGVRTEDRRQRDEAAPGFPEFDIEEEMEAEVARVAVFAQDEWNVTPRLSAYLGLRWEGIRTASAGNAPQEVTSRSSVWSPIAQVLWRLPGTEKDQVRAAIARTYKAPNTWELMPRRFFANNNTPTTPDFEGNPGLKPELSWGLDLGYEHFFEGGGLVSVSAFHRKVDDLIVRELVEIDGTFILRPANEGAATVRGIEFDTKFGLKRWFPGGPATDVRANLALNDSDVEWVPGPHNRLADQTRVTANVGFDHKFGSPPLSIGGTLGYRSGGPIRTSPTQTSHRTPVRTLDLYAVWRFSTKVQLRITANNLLAQDFSLVETYFDGLRTVQQSVAFEGFRGFGAVLEIKL